MTKLESSEMRYIREFDARNNCVVGLMTLSSYTVSFVRSHFHCFPEFFCEPLEQIIEPQNGVVKNTLSL